VSHGLIQKAPRVQLEHRRAAVGVHPAALLHRIPASRRSTGILGRHGGHEHGTSHAVAWPRRPVWQDARNDAVQRCPFRIAGWVVDANALLRSYIWHCIGIPIVASVLMIVHFWRVRKDGGISGPAPVMLTAEADKPRRG